MDKVQEFRRRAEKCRRHARQMPNEELRRLFMDIAGSWDRLASDRERLEPLKKAGGE